MQLTHRQSNPAAEPQGRAAAENPNAVPTFRPFVDVVETGESFVIHADIPGVDESTIDVTLDRGTLTLRAERRLEADAGHQVLVRETGPGRFERQFSVAPEAVASEQVRAAYRNGVLTVTLPKPTSVKARRIQIQSS